MTTRNQALRRRRQICEALGLLIVMAVVLTATLLPNASGVGAHDKGCPASGTVPDTAFVVSSTHQAGRIAGHVVWFQLCRPLQRSSNTVNADGDSPRLTDIALHWGETWEKSFI